MTDSDQHDEKLSALYKTSSDVEPSAQLDKAILAASKQHAGSRSRSIPAKPDYWHLPAALASVAAVVILSILIVPLMLEETQRDDAASYNALQEGSAELMEEKRSLPSVSVPAVPQRAPMADQIDRQNSTPMKARQQSEFSARMKKETIDAEADAMLSAPAGLAAKVPQRSAEGWMESIMQLAAEGKYKQAAEELVLFRKTHPDYTVDESLITTLKGKMQPATGMPDSVK